MGFLKVVEDIGLIPRKILLAVPNQAWPLRRPAEARRQLGGSANRVLHRYYLQNLYKMRTLLSCSRNYDAIVMVVRKHLSNVAVQFCGGIHPFRWSPCK